LSKVRFTEHIEIQPEPRFRGYPMNTLNIYRRRPCENKQESRAVARKPRDAAAVLFGLKIDIIHYKFKSSHASKARLHSERERELY